MHLNVNGYILKLSSYIALIFTHTVWVLHCKVDGKNIGMNHVCCICATVIMCPYSSGTIYCWGRVYTNIFTKKYWSDGFYYLYTYSIELASSPLGYAPWLTFLFKSTLQPIRILLTCIVISVGFLKDCWLNSHSPCPRIAKELDKQAPMRDHKSQITLLNKNKNAQVLPNELTWIKFVAAYETESETPASTAVSEGFFFVVFRNWMNPNT